MEWSHRIVTAKCIKTRSRARDVDDAVTRRGMAALLADEAARLEQVAGFREEVLHGELLRPSEIAAWVQQRHKEDRTPKALKLARSTPADEIQFGRYGVQPVFPGGTL